MARQPATPPTVSNGGWFPCPPGVSLIYLVDGEPLREPGVAWSIENHEGKPAVNLIGVWGSQWSDSITYGVEYPDGRIVTYETLYDNEQSWLAEKLPALA